MDINYNIIPNFYNSFTRQVSTNNNFDTDNYAASEINPENLFKSNDIIIIDETYGNGEENAINDGAVYLRAFEKQLCNLAKTNKLSIFLEDCDEDLNGKQILSLVFEKDKEKAKVLQRVYNTGAKLLAIGHETEYSKINKYIIDISKKISTLQKKRRRFKADIGFRYAGCRFYT